MDNAFSINHNQNQLVTTNIPSVSLRDQYLSNRHNYSESSIHGMSNEVNNCPNDANQQECCDDEEFIDQTGYCVHTCCCRPILIFENSSYQTIKHGNKLNFIIKFVIDPSKALDRVFLTKLWITMFEMENRPVLILALKAYYATSR